MEHLFSYHVARFCLKLEPDIIRKHLKFRHRFNDYDCRRISHFLKGILNSYDTRTSCGLLESPYRISVNTFQVQVPLRKRNFNTRYLKFVFDILV